MRKEALLLKEKMGSRDTTTVSGQYTHSHTHTQSLTHKQSKSFLAATEWSRAPDDPRHLCTKQANRASAVQSPGARARSLQEY